MASLEVIYIWKDLEKTFLHLSSLSCTLGRWMLMMGNFGWQPDFSRFSRCFDMFTNKYACLFRGDLLQDKDYVARSNRQIILCNSNLKRYRDCVHEVMEYVALILASRKVFVEYFRRFFLDLWLLHIWLLDSFIDCLCRQHFIQSELVWFLLHSVNCSFY